MFGAAQMQEWYWHNFPTYLLMQGDFSKSDFETKCNKIITEARAQHPLQHELQYSLQNLKDIHLVSSHLKRDFSYQGNITYVIILDY